MGEPGSAGRGVLFRGRVQGVGFRYTVQEACRRRGLRGWVRNLPDGSVRAEIHGPEKGIHSALSEVRSVHATNLREVVIEAIPGRHDELREFEIHR